jgi:hypothetical protein
LWQSAIAQWSTDPNVNNAICTSANFQYYPTIVSDGAGGAIIAWQDARGSTSWDIYTQCINAAGVVQWTPNGVVICSVANAQFSPMIVSDGAGGAIITWYDYRSGPTCDIYAQHINSAGTVQWTSNGVGICIADSIQQYPMITSDGVGGAIITWEDYRNGSKNSDIYAQHINADSTVQWTSNGIAICTAANNQQRPLIVSDGSGGAIIVWTDSRRYVYNYDIYAQRINATGTVQWTSNGVAVCTTSVNQTPSSIVSDGAGGAIIAWVDYRNGFSNSDIYVQHIDAGGTVQWASNGVAVCAADSNQTYAETFSDGKGGAFIAWFDSRNSSKSYNIYAQRINASGIVQWANNGVAICIADSNKQILVIARDGVGGAIIAWDDNRKGNYDIYAQRIDAAGTVQWTTNGVGVSTASGNQNWPAIVDDGAGGEIITWMDGRGSNNHIYAQKVDRYGKLGITGVEDNSLLPKTTALMQSYPNPFNPTTVINFQLSDHSYTNLKIFDIIGREVTTLVSETLPAGTYTRQWNASGMSSGIYFYRLQVYPNVVGAGSFTETKKLVLLK